MKLRIFVLTATTLVGVPGLVLAEDGVGWSFEAQLGVEREPAYTGSDTYLSEFGGELTATYTDRRGTEWSVGTGGLGVALDLNPTTALDLTLEFEPGRENGDDPILAGFPEMEDTWELQAVYRKDLGPWYLGLGMQADILGKGKGIVGFVGTGYETAVTDRLDVHVGLDLSFADSEHINTEVGVSPATSASTGIASYEASGGYKGATLEAGMKYRLTERMSIVGSVSLESYGSNMSDSPLIATHGTSTNVEAGVGIAFRF